MSFIANVEFDKEKAALTAPVIRMLLKDGETSIVVFACDEIILANSDKDRNLPYTVFVPSAEDQGVAVEEKIKEYEAKYGEKPVYVVLEKTGVYAHGNGKLDADAAMRIFISNLEGNVCEEDRTPATAGRLSEKISIVTGAAQGFGAGIADCMLEEGANMVIADLNVDLARSNAALKCAQFGEGKATACKVDVSDEDSVRDMVYDTVLEYGGLDIIVCNAGIAKAGSLEEMTKNTFELVTKVNYLAFFLCSKYASRIMKIQHKYDPDYYSDIVQVNSKSGLVGSNKNFAYAGSKFGGIGLVQSFALELVEYNIKVNCVCPGNFFDGPLWSDPVKGLFIQYLNAGKVPGAKNVEDVKKYYESKIPMSRGCVPSDVAKAIFYCVEQKYETGQAIPVTGGQVMLK